MSGSWRPGDVGDVNQPHPVEGLLGLLDQAPEGALLMVEVVEHLHIGTIDFAHDLKSVTGRRKKDRGILLRLFHLQGVSSSFCLCCRQLFPLRFLRHIVGLCQ